MKRAALICVVAILAVGYSQNLFMKQDDEARLSPRLLNYQGYLTDDQGIPINNPSLSITFRIFDAVSSGNQKWTETQGSVGVNKGIFSVLLGSVTAIPDSVFTAGTDRWLELVVGGQTLSPRTRITSAGYAYTSTYSDTALYARNAAADDDWVRTTMDSVLFTTRRLGLARGGAGNFLHGDSVHTHVNLGSYACTTGIAGQNYDNITISGGRLNAAHGRHSFIGGGSSNIVYGLGCMISGGTSNRADSNYATVCGGFENTAWALESFIGGGEMNQAHGRVATIGGGAGNTARGYLASIIGGTGNYADSNCTVVCGGEDNRAQAVYAFVGGGYHNHVAGSYSGIIAGYADTIAATGDYSYLFGINSNLTQDSTFMVDMPHIRFGTEVDGYEFPRTRGTTGQIMMTDGGGQLSWSDTPADTDWVISGSNMYSGVSGKVGIGTTNPASELDILSDVETEIRVRSTAFSAGLILERPDTMYGTFMVHRTTGVANNWLHGLDMQSSGDYIFYSYYNSKDVMTLKPNGNIGINNSNASEKLDVIGNINVSSDSGYKIGGTTVLSNPGTSNIFVGAGAGDVGAYVTAVGVSALQANQSDGQGNVAIGYRALFSNTSGDYNTAVGASALMDVTSMGGNTAMGGYALHNTTGLNHTAVGGYSLTGHMTGNSNTALGWGSGRNNIGGSYNTFIGHSAGYNATGSGNVFLGRNAGYSETGNNLLYIDNSDTTAPLIYGEFDNNLVTINGGMHVTGAYYDSDNEAGTSGQLLISTATGTDWTDPVKISFFAYNSGDDNVADGWYKVEFNMEDHDDGSVFNTTDDRFTAPASGVYSFSANVTFSNVTDGVRTVVALYKNGGRSIDLCSGYANSSGAYQTVGGAATIKLNSGDYIEVYLYVQDVTTTHCGSLKYTNFSGHQVY